jgi:hypothetical protein
MTTAPSTKSPKSIAPRLIRLPPTPNSRMTAAAPSIAAGIASATTRPARRLPRDRSKTAITSAPPSIRFLAKVPSVASTRMARS